MTYKNILFLYVISSNTTQNTPSNPHSGCTYPHSGCTYPHSGCTHPSSQSAPVWPALDSTPYRSCVHTSDPAQMNGGLRRGGAGRGERKEMGCEYKRGVDEVQRREDETSEYLLVSLATFAGSPFSTCKEGDKWSEQEQYIWV